VPASRVPNRSHRLGSWLLAALSVLAVSGFSSTAWAEPPDGTLDNLQRVADQLRARLGISHPVEVRLVASNPKLVSVAAPGAPEQPFSLILEEDFAGVLTGDELTAALAHELGHVWVFTHHPFLQTERLANEIAMQVVTRESLARVYRKMWARIGASADVTEYLGPELLRVTRRYAAD
jgi:hypothetical protein